jgi:hypothetical protein
VSNDHIRRRAQQGLARGGSGNAPNDLTPQQKQIYAAEVNTIKNNSGKK